MSDQTRTLVDALRARLRATVRRMTLAELTFGLLLCLGVLSTVWVVSVAVEAGLWLSSGPRALLFWSVIAVGSALFVYFLLMPALRLAGIVRGPSEEAVARQIGLRFPEVSDRLVNLLELADGRRSDAPDDLVEGAVHMLGRQIEPVPFEQVADFSRARRAGRLVTLPLLAVLVFAVAAPSTFLGASLRLLSPGVAFERPAAFRLQVEPGSVELARGASLDVIVRTDGRERPQQLTLSVNNLDEDRVETVTLLADSSGAFRHRLVNVRRSLRYRVEAASVASEWYTARVTERPLVRGLQVSLAFPAYTGIPPQRLEANVGDVAALPGTRVDLEVGIGGQHVREALVRFDDGRVDTLSLDGPTARGAFTLTREGTYQIALRNDQGLENGDPITYSLTLLDDAPPSIVFLAPQPDAVLDEALRASLRARMNDDFGFSRLRLHYRLAETRFGQPTETFEAVPVPLAEPDQLDQEMVHDWLVTERTGLDPVPGDVIEYFLQVWDNDAVAGYKSARTETQRLRLPSLAEQYEQVERSHDAAEQQMEEMLRETERIEEQFQGLRDELRRKQEADWEDNRQLEQLRQQQEALEQQVDELSEKMRSSAEQMQDNSLISPETAQMYRELNKVIEEINSPELMEALRQLQQAVSELDLEQMQESLDQFDFNESQYKERLERTLELFKKIRTQQKLDEAARLAEDLARQQERLQEETRKLLGDERPEDAPDETETPEDARPDEQTGAEDSADGEEEDPDARDDGAPQDEAQTGDEAERDDPSGRRDEAGRRDAESPQDEAEAQDEASPQDPTARERARELSEEQRRASEEMRHLEQKLEEALQQMKDAKGAPTEQMQQLNDETQQQQLPRQMQQNGEQLEQMQLQPAQQGQQKMQQALQQLRQQLQQMQSGMQGQQMQINVAGLRRSLADVLTLSQDQEELRARVRSNASDQTSLRRDAQRQVELSEALSIVSDSLQSLSREIPQMSREVQRHTGEALRAMGQATEAMGERAVGETSGHQTSSMMHLNELALLLTDLMDQLMNSQGSGGGGSMQQMLQQMRQMSQQQQELNQQIQEFLNDVQGNRLSSDMQQRLQQMQRQQQAIQRQLREVSRNPEARGKMLGDLNKIAEQMQETIDELQRRRVDRRTIERQQQILTRLLDAQRSVNQRGRENRREGRSGDDLRRQSPGELPPPEEIEKLRRDLIRALESGYAPDYEELIKRYFELLQQQRQPE